MVRRLPATADSSTEVRIQLVSRLRRVLTSTGLMPLAFRLYRTLRYWRPSRALADRRARAAAPPDAPIPPARHLLATSATLDVEWFLITGRATADAFRAPLCDIGRPIDTFERVLDFGCGCGRVLRQWRDVSGPKFHGSDYNPELVRWCNDRLRCATVRKNDLAPPLSYPSDYFDLCYAVSVFTHLPESLQDAWLAELKRVMKPDGVLLVTLSGEGDLVRTTADEQRRFHNGELVVVDAPFAGTNMCGAYHPEAYVRAKWSTHFDVLAFYPQGASGCPRQDLYVLAA
jgi:SAM-dependent methyltransferase